MATVNQSRKNVKNGCLKVSNKPGKKIPKMTFGTRDLKRFTRPAEVNSNLIHDRDDFRFTEYEERLILNIAHGDPWTIEEREALSNEERKIFFTVLNKGINTLAGNDRDKFYKRVEPVLNLDSKKAVWEQNHFRILSTIDKLTVSYNRFPSRMEIAKETGISRNTINKHLKEYFGSDAFHEKKDEYIVMRESLLAKIYKDASQGDLRACKIFMDATFQTLLPPQIKNQQNNFIQINGTTISREQLEQLPPEKQLQLNEILELVKK